MFVCAVNVIPWDTSYIIPGLPLTVSLQNLKFALPQVGDLCHDSAFFFTSFQSLSLSLFFCCFASLLLWRNGPEMQRIGDRDRDRGWDCDWGFTWLQNKLIQNQQETRNEADDKMEHATTGTVTESEAETATGSAGGRRQTLSSFAARRGPEQMKLKCEAGWQHSSFDIDIEQHPITTATTSTHTHSHIHIHMYIDASNAE